ncbi:MAG: GNAT family N-acetyltransferase [Actinomycetia bacterium]|nr:GNAT family N-acetyltransferase [Actinomycetes bacterium]
MTQPSLRGPRVQLEPLLDADLEPLGTLLAQPGVHRWWGDPSPSALRVALLDASDTLSWSVRVHDELAGAASAFDAGWPPGSTVGLVIALGDAWQDRGLGPEALSLLVAHYVGRGVHRFSVDPVAENTRAIHAYESCGFRPIGVLRQYDPDPAGGWRDCLLMDLLAGEFVDRSGG